MLKVTPGTAKVRPGRVATLKARISATGTTDVAVRLCATVSGKARTFVKPPPCRVLDVTPGQSRVSRLPVKTLRRAKGNYTVRVVASGPGARTVNSNNRIKVTK